MLCESTTKSRFGRFWIALEYLVMSWQKGLAKSSSCWNVNLRKLGSAETAFEISVRSWSELPAKSTSASFGTPASCARGRIDTILLPERSRVWRLGRPCRFEMSRIRLQLKSRWRKSFRLERSSIFSIWFALNTIERSSGKALRPLMDLRKSELMILIELSRF